MKKLLLALFLLLTGSAWAEWVVVTEAPDVVHYLDPTTIRSYGNLRKVWALQSLKRRDKYGVLSRKMKIEFDCNAERLRYLYDSEHKDAMGATEILHMDPSIGPWVDIAPNSANDISLRIVCVR